jgi:clan AA aspartic protease (TIGR02281 family)
MSIKKISLTAGISLAVISVAWAGTTAQKLSASTVGNSAPAQAVTSQPVRNEVALIEQGSALMVHGTVNGTATFTFELDTGASIVVLPRNVAARLVTAADYLGMRTYVFGDGRKRVQPTYRLRSVTVGGLTATNVTCVMGEEEDTFLLGLGFLQRFKSWSIDNERRVLVLQS